LLTLGILPATAHASLRPAGAGAIYTEHAAAIHLLRMVILRIGTIADYLARCALWGPRSFLR
jgi:hypothetical protein